MGGLWLCLMYQCVLYELGEMCTLLKLTKVSFKSVPGIYWPLACGQVFLNYRED